MFGEGRNKEIKVPVRVSLRGDDSRAWAVYWGLQLEGPLEFFLFSWSLGWCSHGVPRT